MLAGPEPAKFDGICFVATIGNSVVRKDRDPASSVEARVGLFHLARGVVNGKRDAH